MHSLLPPPRDFSPRSAALSCHTPPAWNTSRPGLSHTWDHRDCGAGGSGTAPTRLSQVCAQAPAGRGGSSPAFGVRSRNFLFSLPRHKPSPQCWAPRRAKARPHQRAHLRSEPWALARQRERHQQAGAGCTCAERSTGSPFPECTR